MRIAVIGWGSLIWCPKNLMIQDKNWRSDGPKLPIEFARISKYERLTLVIYEPYIVNKNKWVQTYWNLMDTNDLGHAITNLSEREGTKKDFIGAVYRSALATDNQEYTIHRGRIYQGLEKIVSNLEDWLKRKKLDATIWTGLPSNFKAKRKKELSDKTILEYLQGLKKCYKEKAEEYIKNTPPQIETPLRKVIRGKIGW